MPKPHLFKVVRITDDVLHVHSSLHVLYACKYVQYIMNEKLMPLYICMLVHHKHPTIMIKNTEQLT